MIVLPIGDVKFVSAIPGNADGPQVAILSGTPADGPVAVLLKLKRGEVPLHWHSADYHAVIIQGTAEHWAQGERERAKSLGPGSYWFQPAGEIHGDSCVSDECLIFVHFMGKMDTHVVSSSEK